MLMLYSEELIKANPYIPYPIRVSQPTGDPVKIMYKTKRSKVRLQTSIIHKGQKRIADNLKRQMIADNSCVITTNDCSDDDENV